MSAEKIRLLVVDDEKAFLDLFKSYLANRNYDVVCAENAMEAVKAMKKNQFKVVLLDYNMPDFKGSDLISMLQGINPEAKFIVITGMIGEDVEEKFKGSGYYAYFEKGQMPFPEIEEAIQNAYAH